MGNSNNDDDAVLVIVVSLIMCCCMYCMSSSSLSLLGHAAGRTGGGSGYTGQTKTWQEYDSNKVKPGVYESQAYGDMSKPTRAVCPEGSYLTDVMAFHGQGEHTNAIQGWCFDPKTEKATRLFSSATCGKRDRPKAKNIFMDASNIFMLMLSGGLAAPAAVLGFASSAIPQSIGLADAKTNLLRGGYGRAVYDYKLIASPAGIYKWAVRPKDNEIQGLNLWGLRGEEMGWAGGNASKTIGPSGPRKGNPTGNITVGTCPKGKIVKGIVASCGDRVDGLKFICDVPPFIAEK